MTNQNIEWQKKKAEDLLKRQVELLAESQFPEAALAEGMTEAYYAIGVFSDVQYGYWARSIATAVGDRRTVLASERIQRLLADGPKLQLE